MSNVRKGCVALLSLRVKGHSLGAGVQYGECQSWHVGCVGGVLGGGGGLGMWVGCGGRWG